MVLDKRHLSKHQSLHLSSRVTLPVPKSKWKDLIIIVVIMIASIHTELVSFLALSKHFKFTALLNLYNLSGENLYTNFTNEAPKG